ncbi:unnamed protein product [Fraxinus pennsylvanica]|uniref:Uncharacterized protein n=1 Tax=Fraxinus pennsylvanica TaxID=56036 RepID=A0AAD2AA78_9LAMI|nr:unnamed protein product [Fraxinus pennsylvanica]
MFPSLEIAIKWSAIAEKLPGRTDNSIKNYWHAHVKKRNRRNAAATGQIKQHLCEASQLSEILHEQQPNLISSKANHLNESSPKDFVVAESSYLQALDNLVPPLNNTTCGVHDDKIIGDSDEGNFWSELCQINYLDSSMETNYDDLLFTDPYIMSPQGPQHWIAKNSTLSFGSVAETQEFFWAEPEGGLFSHSFLYYDDN